jgi:hypothetical protein
MRGIPFPLPQAKVLFLPQFDLKTTLNRELFKSLKALMAVAYKLMSPFMP